MPNKERIKLWVDALRSGTYQQTKNALIRDEGSDPSRYCCLGVACEVYLKDNPLLTTREIFWRDFSGWGALPSHVMKWFEFSLADVILSPTLRDCEITGIMANDKYAWTFEQIAQTLESTYLTEKPNAE